VWSAISTTSPKHAGGTALRDAKAAAESATAARTVFLAALSHELRRPLTARADDAATLRKTAAPCEVREQLGMMERNIALEGRLIDEFSNLSPSPRQIAFVPRQLMRYAFVVRLADRIVRDDALTKEIKTRLPFECGAQRVITDPARVQQMFGISWPMQ